VGAVEVVVGEVALEFALEALEAQVEIAGEGWSPALVDDRLVDPRRRSAGMRVDPERTSEVAPKAICSGLKSSKAL
jgi:hypothetical protein